MIVIDKLKIDGFATKSWLVWEMVSIEMKNVLSSNDRLFFDRIDAIVKLMPNIININNIVSFLLLVDKDYKARLYINDEIPLVMWVKPKRDLQKGEPVYRNDILDINKISFDGIDVTEEDRIIYCQKVERKFFLYYDLWRTQRRLDLDIMYKELWAIYRSLFFERTYLLLKEGNFDKTMNDWWFPFVEIIPDYHQILSYYNEDKPKRDIFISKYIDSYDQKIDSITEKWRSKEVFLNKQDIITSWLKSYKQNDQNGFISCIKILSSEIEWIIRVSYYQEKNFSKNSQKESLKEYINNIIKYWKEKQTTLFFPNLFLSFLNNTFFESWYLWDDSKLPSTTRHTVNHGILPSAWYTKEKAFQMIMILDQIYFYLP